MSPIWESKSEITDNPSRFFQCVRYTGTFVVTERQTKAKHLQAIAGVSPTVYFLSTFLWDVSPFFGSHRLLVCL